ncbi:417_t:CDS:2, partial [Ambispora leptoticha]
MEEKDGWQDKVDNLKNLLSEKQTKQAEVEKLFNQRCGFYEKEIEELKQQNQAKRQSSELWDLINQKDSSLNKLTNKKKQATQKIRGLVQEQKNQEGKHEEHICLPVDNGELTRLRQENQKKEQKIGELEQVIEELRDKPPIQTIDQPTQTETKPEPSNSERETLLIEINQQKATIQQLQTQLQQAQEPQTIIKEIPKIDLTTIQQLQTKLRKKEQTITQLHITWLLFLGSDTSSPFPFLGSKPHTSPASILVCIFLLR